MVRRHDRLAVGLAMGMVADFLIHGLHSPRLRGEAGICVFFAQIPGEGAPPQPELGGESEPAERPLTPTSPRKRGEGAEAPPQTLTAAGRTRTPRCRR